MTESWILCEGYHDRGFWAGWLTHLGCSDVGFRPGTPGYPTRDPGGDKIAGGKYAYHGKSGGFLCVVPCGGKTNILPEARLRLRQRTSSRTPLRLVINIDPDVVVSGSAAGPAGIKLYDVLHLAQSFDPSAKQNADGEIEMDGGATKAALVRWEVSDPVTRGIPDQQTLERLVSAAIVAAHPARATAVQDWLDGRPTPPAISPKDHSWSYMAGWYSENGCEFFYQNLWNDAAVVQELESRLKASGAWRIAELIAG